MEFVRAQEAKSAVQTVAAKTFHAVATLEENFRQI